jgi:hypothetical protein
VIIMHESIPGVIIPPPQGTLVGFWSDWLQ